MVNLLIAKLARAIQATVGLVVLEAIFDIDSGFVFKLYGATFRFNYENTFF